jgi:dTDP-4-amino-4,6-dideoxygalactose transaminase
MIPLFKVNMVDSAIKEVNKTLASGFIGQGPKVGEFELRLMEWIDNDCIVTTNSATSGIHLSLHLLKKYFNEEKGIKIDDGDEVLCTPLTCTATNWPVLANNFNIKWVDINKNNLNMDLDDLEKKITSKTKIILVVHWGGYPIDIDGIKKIQLKAKEKYGFKPIIIEDCAHACGSTYKGKKLGNHGNICIYSFQAIKHLTSGDGGMVVFPNNNLYKRAKLLRWYGIDRENNKDFRIEGDISEWGYKFHMNDINASIGIENLKNINEIVKIHQDNAKYYDNKLKNISDITILERKKDRTSSFWIYSMLVNNKKGFKKYMKECNIMVSQVHERNDTHSCVNKYKNTLPTLDKITPQLISIPVGWWVSKEEREYIVDCIKRGW